MSRGNQPWVRESLPTRVIHVKLAQQPGPGRFSGVALVCLHRLRVSGTNRQLSGGFSCCPCAQRRYPDTMRSVGFSLPANQPAPRFGALYSSPPPFAQDLTHRAACTPEKARLRSNSSTPPGVRTEEGVGYPYAEISHAWHRRTVLLTFECLDDCARARSQGNQLGVKVTAR